VLDTWFSSALWPHSTLRLAGADAGTGLLLSHQRAHHQRDIISLWVARMVITGLYNIGKIPFHEVFIHPKILDGYGEGMSKSKGNGVDPLDVIEKFGADALRFGLVHDYRDARRSHAGRVRMPALPEAHRVRPRRTASAPRGQVQATAARNFPRNGPRNRKTRPAAGSG